MYGVLDVPLLFLELYEKHDIFLRSLGDRLHFRIPIWGKQLSKFGVIEGSRDNCAALFEDEECVLVFPGGAREVAKRRDEKYSLIWKERIGFARMAIEYGVTIVPFAAIGVEELFDIVADANDLLGTRIGRWARKLGVRNDIVFPLSVPTGKLERFYFQIQEPVRTEGRYTNSSDDDQCWRLREEVSRSVNDGISELLEFRENDPYRHIPSRAGIGSS
jgi:1-acyl-sn-glycerol-3-phosphate acyltransferase